MTGSFKIVADERTAQVVHRKTGPLEVAEVFEYHTARTVARTLSQDTSGRYTVVPPEGSLIRPEAFANGVSEATR